MSRKLCTCTSQCIATRYYCINKLTTFFITADIPITVLEWKSSRPLRVLKNRLKIRVPIYLFLSVGRKMTPFPETVSDPMIQSCESAEISVRVGPCVEWPQENHENHEPNRQARVAQWWEHSPPTKWIPESTPYVVWDCCLFSPLLREVFLWVP